MMMMIKLKLGEREAALGSLQFEDVGGVGSWYSGAAQANVRENLWVRSVAAC